MAQLELKYLSLLKLGDFLTCCLAISFKFNCSIVKEESSGSQGNIGSSESYKTPGPLTALIEAINSYWGEETLQWSCLQTRQEAPRMGWAF